MKKIVSLLKACMTSDMNIFKIKTKNKKVSLILPIVIGLYLMFLIWGSANALFEKFAPLHMQYILLSFFAFVISIMTLMEGIYKTSSLIFNCKDDDLLLSLPIKRRTVLFVRIFKFYVFELIYNSLFLLPIMIAYIRWADTLSWTYFLTSIVMLFFLPIIPIVISCFIGVITSSLSSKTKYKNMVQIIISIALLVTILFISYNTDKVVEYLMKNATSLNEVITKLYYPAGIYAKLATDFSFIDLLVFIIISGFALVLFLVAIIIIIFRFDSFMPILTSKEGGLGLSKEVITSNMSLIIFLLLSITAYMTSITNSVISLEGKNINILKSLPVKVKTILMSKILACSVITTPILLIGLIILFIKFKTGIVDSIMLLILSILIPLVSHFIGIIVNLKYPKLDAENSTEIVKQSTSSFISVMIGMVLAFISVFIGIKIIGSINATLALLFITLVYIVINIVLYMILIKIGVKDFKKLAA